MKIRLKTMVWGVLLIGFAVAITSCTAGNRKRQPSGAKSKAPALVVGIVVDQMRYDYLARFWNHFGDGGFKRLVGEGVSFSNCNFNYVPTETAPGHASIFTGTTPSEHGIIMNNWLDHSAIAAGKAILHSSVSDSLYPLLGIPKVSVKGRGASPARLEATTIADQLKLVTAGKAKTIGVSLKDRSAILPVGKSADAAFWFEATKGQMVSSTYYPAMQAGFPAWADSFNAKQTPRKLLSDPIGWTLLLPATAYSATDDAQDIPYEGTYPAQTGTNFPHHFKVDPINCCGEFMATAWGNAFVKDFAKEVVTQYGLGSDAITDFLSLSFSSTDMVAHQFGIESREVEDTYIRLDRDLADFLSFLDAKVGKGKTLVFLTADHGGAPNPNYANAHGQEGGWLEAEILHKKIRERLGDQSGQDSLLFAVQGHNIYLNRRLAAARNLDLDSLRQEVVAATKGFPGVLRAYTATEILTLQPRTTEEMCLKNGYYADRCGDVLLLESYGFMEPPYDPSDAGRYKKGTTHGSHYEYDTHVPLLFWGWEIPKMQSDVLVVIPDIAATICNRLKLAPTSKCSGKVLVME